MTEILELLIGRNTERMNVTTNTFAKVKKLILIGGNKVPVSSVSDFAHYFLYPEKQVLGTDMII